MEAVDLVVAQRLRLAVAVEQQVAGRRANRSSPPTTPTRGDWKRGGKGLQVRVERHQGAMTWIIARLHHCSQDMNR